MSRRTVGAWLACLAALGLLVIYGGASSWLRHRRAPARPLSAVPEEHDEDGAPPPPVTLSGAAIYLQTDPRWADDKIGGSGETLRSVGCTVCCISMALAHHGVDLDPGKLNRALIERGGYTSRGWVKWDAVRQITSGKVRVRIPRSPAPSDIREALAAGSPVIVKVRLRSGILHWVLVVGLRDGGAGGGGEYLIKDPLGNGEGLEPLSKFGSDVLAVRIVEKRG